ncbi:hypothetical protein F5146DRAFT_767681 [Armillaria mellea]|nr:hypothetical protein F5146DRAFT_767681 [Armillaria mellea]
MYLKYYLPLLLQVVASPSTYSTYERTQADCPPPSHLDLILPLFGLLLLDPYTVLVPIPFSCVLIHYRTAPRRDIGPFVVSAGRHSKSVHKNSVRDQKPSTVPELETHLQLTY